MRNYELMTITKASLAEDKAKAVSKEIQDLIVANKGLVTKADAWGKRKFAYEIKRDKEGYYDVIQFELDPEAISKVKGKLKLMDNIIRYLITAQS
jgi:small subunit ribosomal protein S6